MTVLFMLRCYFSRRFVFFLHAHYCREKEGEVVTHTHTHTHTHTYILYFSVSSVMEISFFFLNPDNKGKHTHLECTPKK